MTRKREKRRREGEKGEMEDRDRVSDKQKKR